MADWRRFLSLSALLILGLALAMAGHLRAAPAGTVHYPDLQTILPSSSFIIANPTPATRELRYTHHSANLGDGPLEVRPQYDPTTDTARAFQRLYTHDASGNWILSAEVPLVGRFVYHPAHGHYHFPFAQFGLYQVAPDGSIGSQILLSPKVGFCLGDDFAENSSLPHFGALGYSGGFCGDPTHVEGISVGWSDVYDSTDAGQSIDITTLPDGTYWFRAIADPDNYFTEKDKTNNITDVKLQIAGATVSVIGTPVHPNSQPPAVTITAPANGTVSGSAVQATATASDPSGIVSLQFLLDGSPLGTPFTAPPYSLLWDSTLTPNGTHYLSAQAKAGTTFLGTASPVVVTVANNVPPPPPPPPGTFGVDKVVPIDGAGTISIASFGTAQANELLVAFAASDGPTTGGQTLAISAANLTWTLVKRANTQLGAAEIWSALASSTLSGAVITSTQRFGGYHQSLTVVAFTGASGTGAYALAGGSTGAPSVSISTTHDGSFVYGVGNDWDNAIGRTLPSNQTLVHQWIDTATGDTYWAQAFTAAVPTHGTSVTLNDTAPTTDRWNLAAVEIVPSALPAVAISNVLATNRTASSASITWTTNVPSTSTVNYGLDTTYGRSISDLALVTNHSVALTGLAPFTTYHYRLSSDAGGGNTATAGDFIFTTPVLSQIACTITAPPDGQTVLGTIPVSAHATSTADVAGIQFQLDGANLGAEVLTPITDATIKWDTTSAANSNHVLTCIARDPTGNTATSPKVNVTVANPVPVAVPNVVGLTQAAATSAITAATLTLGSTSTALSATIPAGSVISQNPAPGTPVMPGSPVALVVSLGGAMVPNVVGATQSAASATLNGAQLTVGAVSMAASAVVPAGSVISESPGAGTLVALGSAVALVISTGPPPVTLAVDVTVPSSDGAGTRTTQAFNTSVAGDVLLAFAASDGPASGTQALTISGAGLTWSLVKRANGQRGTAEIWTATAATQLTNVTVRSTQVATGFHQSLTVVAFKNAAGVGASAGAGATSGAPTVSVTTTSGRSLVYGMGNDWDNPIGRVLPPGQVLVHQWVDTGTGDTYWAQAMSGAIALAGTIVRLADTSPTTDSWNFVGVEVLAK
jgi:hypothetical protein